MPGTRHILVALDRSRASIAALYEAVRIAAWDRAGIVVLHVIDAPSAPETEDLAGVVGLGELSELTPHETLGVSGALAEFRGLAAPALAGKPDARVLVRVGRPFAAIVDCLGECKADTLVMGATGDGGAGAGLGALAARCLRSALARVLLLRKWEPGPFMHVVVAIDYSENSRVLLDQAVRIACQDQARLDIVHIEEPPETAEAPPSADFRAATQECARAPMDAFLKPLRPEMRYLHGERHVINHVDRQTAIVAYARRCGCDLVVLGTRRRTEADGVMAASTSERIVRDVPCSVLTIKREPSAREHIQTTSSTCLQSPPEKESTR